MSDDPASLDRLHDIVAPPPVPWWPPAPGWYWVLGFAAVLLVLGSIRFCIRWQRSAYRREALAEWEHRRALLAEPDRRAGALAGMAELLKRTALSAFPRPQVAPLTGTDWLAFLHRTGGAITEDSLTLLEQAVYDPAGAAATSGQKWHAAALQVRHWLKHHKTKGAPPC
jgi:hypothetical protein